MHGQPATIRKSSFGISGGIGAAGASSGGYLPSFGGGASTRPTGMLGGGEC